MRNFKKGAMIAIFLCLCLLGNAVMTFFFYPYNYARIDVHNIETNAYDDLFLGSSHGKCGINPLVVDSVTNQKSTNLCMGGEYLQDVYFLAKETSRNHKPKRIIYELDPGYWVTNPAQGMDYASFYQEFPWSTVKLQYFAEKIAKADFRTTLFPWYVYRQYFRNALTNAETKISSIYKDYDSSPFKSEAQSYEPEGFIYRNAIDAPKTEENMILWDEANLQSEAKKYFEKLASFCHNNDIELIVITTPIPTESYQKHQAQYDDATEYFTNYMESLSVPYYDFNHIELPGFDRTLNSYADYEGHMYGDIANYFSKLLGTHLNNM